jgi:hypothetical protein
LERLSLSAVREALRERRVVLDVDGIERLHYLDIVLELRVVTAA